MTTGLAGTTRQWSRRPDDERFLSLDDLQRAVDARRSESWTLTSAVQDLRVRVADGADAITLDGYDLSQGERRTLTPTHHAFGQLARYANAPGDYLRKLPAELAAINLQWGIEHNPIREHSLVLGQSNGSNTLRAMTSTSYGRIWDGQVVQAVQRVNEDGRWKVPSASYATTNPKRASTLYASDRDVFVFLVDEANAIEVGGDTLFRGFVARNSEVGASVFGLTTFLYRYVCDNRLIWVSTEVQELRIRHTSGAPDRFAYEGAKYLRRYAEESSKQIVDSIRQAQAKEIPDGDQPGKGWEVWLQQRGFTNTIARSAVQMAQAEEGEARSLWDIINGITAYARSYTHTDARVQLETAAGGLMSYASS